MNGLLRSLLEVAVREALRLPLQLRDAGKLLEPL
jgi:hypothetical protein